MKILLVEDEHKTGTYLAQGLKESGFVVDLATNGPDGLHLALTESYDLLVLDIMLPGLDGWNILTTLRNTQNDVPVLFLSAKDEVADKVKGLELGADDYLVKPFDFTELLARIRSLLRRRTGMKADTATLQVADVELDIARRHVTRAGQPITLTAKEFSLLELFMRHQGEVLSRQQIASQVWDMNFDSDTNIIDVAVRRLRSKIDEDFDTKLIKTLRGMGYSMTTDA